VTDRMTQVRLQVNGQTHTADAEPRRTLSDFLRHDLGFTGTHVGCEHGVCGACTVLLDGEPVRACLIFAVQVEGRNVETVEGLTTDGSMGLLQEELRAAHAFQCGFCTPGVLMTATAMIRECSERPSRQQIREELSGHICRCSGYQPIVTGIEAAARRTLDEAEGATA
jgi:aerobic carbon-monoxide dehydrogenase small subunit